jgi:glycosyltransferase involved in cell wall biosynthesis
LVPYNNAEALGQAAVTLLGDGERRAALVARGRERLHEVYHETVCVEKIETVYREVLARKGHHLPPPTKRL